MASYPASSPYYLTNIVDGEYLDFMVNRVIPSDPSDQLWEITPTYNLRPDLLANDMYNDSRLWWVFAQRNPNRMPDPLYSFTTGNKIYLPNLDTLKQVLGI